MIHQTHIIQPKITPQSSRVGKSKSKKRKDKKGGGSMLGLERERERGTRFQSQPHRGRQKQPEDVFWRVNDNFNQKVKVKDMNLLIFGFELGVKLTGFDLGAISPSSLIKYFYHIYFFFSFLFFFLLLLFKFYSNFFIQWLSFGSFFSAIESYCT